MTKRTADRSILFERLLDLLSLYFRQRDDYEAKYRDLDDPTMADELLWQERSHLDALMQLARRALDEYVLTGLTRWPDVMEQPGPGDGTLNEEPRSE